MPFCRLLFLCCLCLGLRLAAADTGSVQSRGLEIHYRVAGTGTPLLILGGGPGDGADRYQALFDKLSSQARCILVEQRGTGKSMPEVKNATTLNLAATLEDFEAIRRRLGLERWSVLGSGYGGYLASLYAHTYPESVSSMVLLGSMGLNWDNLPVFQENVRNRMWPSDLAALARWSAPEPMQADRQLALTEARRAQLPGHFFDRKKAMKAAQDLKPADFDFDLGEWIRKDSVARKLDLAVLPVRFLGPVLVLNGREDPCGEALPEALAKYYPGSRLRFIEKCGHYAWLEKSGRVMAAVAEFLAAK